MVRVFRYPDLSSPSLLKRFLRSHATYTYSAAGCYLALKTEEGLNRAQELFDKLPALLSKKRPGGQDLPTEVYIQKKSELVDMAGSPKANRSFPSHLLESKDGTLELFRKSADTLRPMHPHQSSRRAWRL